MPNFLAGLSFGAPWLLAALVVLPVIWWLLRVTPPLARRVVFPPLRLLLGLKDPEETPARTPFLLLLLRMLAAAAAIVALAQPLIGQPPPLPGKGPLILFIDNGWTAAHAWDARKANISDFLNAAQKAGRAVSIVPTADTPSVSLLDAGAAARAALELEPEPWAAKRLAAAKALAQTKLTERPDIVWLSDGIDDGTARDTADTLAAAGNLKILADDSVKGPLALLPPKTEANGFDVALVRGDPQGARDGEVAALGARDETLAAAHFHFEDGKAEAHARIVLPAEVRAESSRIVIVNEESSGAVQLLDQGGAPRAVGIVSASSTESGQPLLSDVYYLERALSPYADVRKGTISSLLDKGVSVLMLADVGRVAGTDRDRVASFVADGGVLVRFAGERMTNESDDLVPVKLRTGGRYLGGALAWASPQHLAPFGDASPFAGLAVPADVTVSRQILAEPSVELSARTWARLQDGTPLVTAAQNGKGWIVLFHTTAGPNWSSLPLSGLYVDMLRRLLALASGAKPTEMAAATSLPAIETLDGLGQPRRPPADVTPIAAAQIAKTTVSRAHPPGLYGTEGTAMALNLVNNDTTLQPFGDLGHPVEAYQGTRAFSFEPLLLAAAFLLLLIDAVVSLWLRGYLVSPQRILARGTAAVIALMIVWPIHDARADDAADMKAALDTRLAYVVTGLPDVDDMSRAGLVGLGLALKERTSYEPQDPVGVDVARDNLNFFPLLYWPIDPREKDLPPQALSKISDYMRSGGTILFDTRDLTLGSVRGAQSPGEQTLRRLISKLDLPPLQPVPSDHVLTKAFYLLSDFPGRWDGGKIWVEALPPADPREGPAPARGGDGVSPVIIGGNDWAAAWAVDSSGRPIVDVVPGGERQRELALRFGINLVMYALTGNYKTDQVHVNALLERLGK